jgi:hypothetical protein
VPFRKLSFALMPAILAACFLFSCAWAGDFLDFDIPVPGNSKLLDSKELILGMRQVNTSLFGSDEPADSAAAFYIDFFGKKDFEKVLDKIYPKTGKRLLRFKKDTLVASISIIRKGDNTEIVIAKYLQMPGDLPPEKTKPSVKDTIFALPASDVEGIDAPGIPRPSPSVRIMGLKMGQGIMAMYTTPLDVDSAVDFYCSRMPSHHWQLVLKSGAKEGMDEYLKVNKKESLGIQSPFSDGEDFEQVVRESVVLNFSAGSENAEITIFPNFSSRALGSIVQVSYSGQE